MSDIIDKSIISDKEYKINIDIKSICIDNNNFENIEVNDLLENINILIKYIISKKPIKIKLKP